MELSSASGFCEESTLGSAQGPRGGLSHSPLNLSAGHCEADVHPKPPANGQENEPDMPGTQFPPQQDSEAKPPKGEADSTELLDSHSSTIYNKKTYTPIIYHKKQESHIVFTLFELHKNQLMKDKQVTLTV